MIPLTAAHNSVELYEKVHSLYLKANRYLQESDPKFIEILDEINHFGKNEPATRSSLLCRLYGLTGDRKKAEYYLDNAKKLHVDEVEYDLAQITVLLALGYFSEAAPALRRCEDPKRDALNLFLASPPTGGWFHLLQEFHERAIAMRLTNVPDFSEAFVDAIEIMGAWGDTDEDYAAALDIAGRVMRRHRMFTSGPGVQVETRTESPDGGPGYVKLAFLVDVDLDTSIDMTMEYAGLLACSGIKIPQSMVFEFESNQQ